TATAVLTPPAVGTPVPTKPAGPTLPPVATPTQGEVAPTPTAAPTTFTQAEPTLAPAVPPTAAPTSSVPGVPNTGALDPSRVETSNSNQNTAPILFTVFYDRNKNKALDKGESIRAITVYFTNDGQAALSSGL